MEFDEIMVKESPGLCRCCLSEGCYKDMGSEYNWMNETEVYADMLLECFDISISQHNEGPNGVNRLICEVCITRLRDACNFKRQVLDSEKKFVDMIGRGEFRPKVLIYQADMKAEGVEIPTEEAEIEFLEDEMDYGEELETNEPEATVSDITVSTLPVKNKRGRPKKTSTVVKAEKKVKVAKMEEKAKSNKSFIKGVRWDSATNIKFIEAYQRNTCLWDPKNPHYKNKQARYVSYRNIKQAMEMELTVKDVISKIRSLRNTYNSEMLKEKKSLTMGARRIYKSKIPWIDSLDFLKNIDTTTTSTWTCTRTSTDNLEDHTKLHSGDGASSNKKNDSDQNIEHSYTSNESKRGKIYPLTKAVRALIKVCQQRYNDECDEFDSFGNLVAKKLRNLPLKLALKSEEMILALLRKQRVRALRSDVISPTLSSERLGDGHIVQDEIPYVVETNLQESEQDTDCEDSRQYIYLKP